MAGFLLYELFEQILKRVDAEDLIRCKCVCWTWRGRISSRRFIKAHLNHSYNNDRDNYELGGHRRIVLPTNECEDHLYYCQSYHIVGSSDGLVCVSPRDTQLLVTNPCTRQVKILTPIPQPSRPPINGRHSVCWGFGYDSSIDDYKVILGLFTTGHHKTRFYALTLKSNTWKLIGEVRYTRFYTPSAILCNGALHWFFNHNQNTNKRKVILSFDLSREEFNEIPLPNHDHLLYEESDDHRLGVVDECLCIFSYQSTSSKKWVLKNYNFVKPTWELFPYDHEIKYDAIHYLNLKRLGCYITKLHSATFPYDGYDGIINLSIARDYIRAHVFVQSLVSPHSNNKNGSHIKRRTKKNRTNVKAGFRDPIISRKILINDSVATIVK